MTSKNQDFETMLKENTKKEKIPSHPYKHGPGTNSFDKSLFHHLEFSSCSMWIHGLVF